MRPRRTSRETLEVVERARLRQRLSRSSTRRGPARGRPRSTTRCRRRSCRSGSIGWWRCRSAIALERSRAQVGADARGARGGRRTRRAGRPRRERARTGSCTCADVLAPGTFVDARVTAAAPHHLTGRARAAPARRGLSTWLRARSPWWVPPRRGKTEAAIALAGRSARRSCRVDSMLVYRGMDVGTAKPTPAQRARVPHHLIDLAEPSERFTRGPVPGAGRTRSPRSRRGAPAAARRRARACTSARWWTTSRSPGGRRRPGQRSRREADAVGVDALYRRLAARDPVAAAQDRAGQRPAHRSRPGGRARSPAAPFSSVRRGVGAL